jgi:hypothetical protein
MDIRLYMKFGEKSHLDRMRKEGILYCNTITYFSKIEDDVRGDPSESVSKQKYYGKALFQLKPANEPSAELKNLNATNVMYKEKFDEPLGNLFCMSAFKVYPKKEISIFDFDARFSRKFEYCLMILRQDLFVQRLQKAFAKLSFKTCMKLVEYTDLLKYSRPKTLFQKDINYSWQEELRIILYTEKFKMDDPYEFSIGSIEDISEIIDLKKTKKLEYKL